MYQERSGSLGSQGAFVASSTNINEPLGGGSGGGGDVVDNLDDARKLVRDLRQKTRAQAQQIMAWRRAYKMQELVIGRLQREKCDQFKALSAKLLLFESRLIRKQKDISAMLNVRENIIHRQQRIIETLTNRLIDNGLEVPQSELAELETSLPDLDSLNDSDSAVVMEDIDSDSTFFNMPKFRSGSVDGAITVVRSISDAIDPNLKYTSVRRNNGFLRRPEILETVYSVEEDADIDGQGDAKTEANKKRDAFASRGKTLACKIDGGGGGSSSETSDKDRPPLEEKVCSVPNWPYERADNDQQQQQQQQQHHHHQQQEDKGETKTTNQVKTYNRVMSNHRSVTKPKDVKYKRINKAKSKSLEELRGRLKNWVEQGTKLTGIALEHSQSYA